MFDSVNPATLWLGEGAPELRRAIVIPRRADALYDLWREPATFPHVMASVAQITVLSRVASRWTVRILPGKSVTWDAWIIDETPASFIAWATEKRAVVPNAGRMTFQPLGDGQQTEVTMTLRFQPPGGLLGRLVSRFITQLPEAMLGQALGRFKTLAEQQLRV